MFLSPTPSRSALRVASADKGKLKLSSARFVASPSSIWSTPSGSLNGEWKVFFDKVLDDGDLFIEPHIIIIFVDAITGETAKFPMI